MTPKDKAKELVDKYMPYVDTLHNGIFENSKQCALRTIYEIMEELDSIRDITGSSFILELIEYYQKVKQEIKKL